MYSHYLISYHFVLLAINILHALLNQYLSGFRCFCSSIASLFVAVRSLASVMFSDQSLRRLQLLQLPITWLSDGGCSPKDLRATCDRVFERCTSG
jgi:hypothetical protein